MGKARGEYLVDDDWWRYNIAKIQLQISNIYLYLFLPLSYSCLSLLCMTLHSYAWYKIRYPIIAFYYYYYIFFCPEAHDSATDYFMSKPIRADCDGRKHSIGTQQRNCFCTNFCGTIKGMVRSNFRKLGILRYFYTYIEKDNREEQRPAPRRCWRTLISFHVATFRPHSFCNRHYVHKHRCKGDSNTAAASRIHNSCLTLYNVGFLQKSY